MLKKFLLSLFIGCTLLLPVATQAVNLGGDLVETARNKAGYKAATETTLAENVGSIIKVMLSLVGIIFTVLMVYAGYLWMTARGEASQVEKAQEIIKSSIIGIIITLAAYSISNFVVSKVVSKTSASNGPIAITLDIA